MRKNLLVAILVLISSLSFAQAWQNPMNLSGQADMGIGDPYILKFRGTYYMYSSSRDVEIRCWKSKDMVNWSNAIICSTDPSAKNAYAPEVVYWNGTFYMYTSPQGNGHYVLKSNSPTGPFVPVTDNIGKKIDGSVFIDDNGKWYFYHANSAGIQGCTMETPTTFGQSVNLNAQMNGQWTEAPCLIKRNGIYYLLYTGNHVWSNGYRVDYAINTTESPVNAYSPQMNQNPILVKTEGSFIGLGHGTAFIGPDLDTYYFTYHNLVRIGGGMAPSRQFNYDRMAWNGDKLLMLGPTNWVQQAPELATSDFFERNDIGKDWKMPNGGNWGILNQDLMFQDKIDAEYKAVFTALSAPDYTAEFTVREKAKNGNEAKVGALFSYVDEENHGVVLLNSHTNQLEIAFQINNSWSTTQTYSLPEGFNYAVWHSIRIEKAGNTYKFFVDGMNKATLTSELDGGQAGYITRNCEGHFAYIAINNKVQGSGIFDAYKPIPGDIQAIHYNTGGEGIGYHDLTTGNTGDSDNQYYRVDDVDVSKNVDGGFHITAIQAGEWYKYNVNVKSTATYNVGIRYSTTHSSAQIKISQGEKELTEAVTLPDTRGAWQTYTIKGLTMTSGYHTLKIEAIQGEFELYEMQFKEGNITAATLTDTFDTSFGKSWNYLDGTWQIVSGQASINGYGKRTLGNTGWTDYTIDCDITYVQGMNAGLIFRVNNPAKGGENTSAQLGTDFLQGYFVGIGADKVTLGKHNYSWKSLTTAAGSYSLNKKYHVRVVTEGANIKVYVDNMDIPKIDYTDPSPIISGKVGFRSHSTHVLYDNLTVAANTDPVSIKQTSASLNGRFYPNPVKDILTVEMNDEVDNIRIYDLIGGLMYAQQNSEAISLAHFPSGVYILQVETASVIGNWKMIKE